jgi:hypothetical protein
MEQHSPPDSSNSGSARLRVLEMIDEGTITAEEGLRLLQAFSAADETAEAADKLEFLAGSAENPAGEAEIPLPGGASTATPPSAGQTAGFTTSQPGPTGPAADYSSAGLPANVRSTVEPPAAVLLDAVPPPTSQTSARQPATTAPGALPADALKWKRWWMVPVWIGVAITVFGGLFMYLAMRSSGIGFWFVCASTPFILGLVLIVLAWGSRKAPWLHLRVQQPPGEKPEKIAFSMPLPIRPAAWFLRTFGHWIPSLKEQSFDELILAVGDKTGPDNPLYIVVDEQETGEKVEIYIG